MTPDEIIQRLAGAAKLTNALALLGNTPEQVTDWCRAFAAYASVGGTIHDLETISYEIAIGAHKPQKEPTMTTNFTATNGLTFTFPEDGSIRWESGHPPRLVTEALREYFTHERDQELGRWRDPENPDLVVYPNGDTAVVLCEASGASWDVARPRHLTGLEGSSWLATAARYFAAHPEPRPWHSAEPGDVWLLTINDEQAPAITFQDKNTGQTLFATPTLTDLEPGRLLITAGQLIWPTEDDDE